MENLENKTEYTDLSGVDLKGFLIGFFGVLVLAGLYSSPWKKISEQSMLVIRGDTKDQILTLIDKKHIGKQIITGPGEYTIGDRLFINSDTFLLFQSREKNPEDVNNASREYIDSQDIQILSE